MVAADRSWDLVVAAVAGLPGEVPCLKITGAIPEVGERVAVVGSPLGLEQTLSDGVISALRRTSAGSYPQISAPVSTGSSGSPVVNMKGEVVGVTSLQVVRGQNPNFAVPGSRAWPCRRKPGATDWPLLPWLAWNSRLDRSGGVDRYYRYATVKHPHRAEPLTGRPSTANPNWPEHFPAWGGRFIPEAAAVLQRKWL